jgi:hypothetical protein
MGKKKVITVTMKKFAQLRGVPYTTVADWVKKNRIPAERVETPMGHVWMIPEAAPLPEPPIGRPKKDR